MTQLFVNNFSTTLSQTFGVSDTFMHLTSVTGLPAINGGNYLLLTVFRKVGVEESGHEVVRATAITGNQLTVVRAVEGAAASIFNIGDLVEARVTAAALAAKADLNSPTFTGPVGGITAAMVGAPSGSGTSTGTNTGDQDLSGKQDALVSGTNIKTVNGVTLLGGGNVSVASAPIGSLLPMAGITANPLEFDGQVWLRTGTVADRTTYPNGPGCISTQGATVTGGPFPVGGTLYTSYTNGLFVVVCSATQGIWTSADGFDWTPHALPSNIPAGTISYCAYGAGVYVFLANSAVVYTTSDFVTYTRVALPNTAYSGGFGGSIAFCNGLFVYCCVNAAYLYTSPDGSTWTQRTLPYTATYCGCAYGASKWVVTAQEGSYSMGAYSSNGITWTNIPRPSETARSAPIFANGIFICHSTTNVLTSATGTSFTANALPGSPSNYQNPLAWTGSVFLATSVSGALYSSATGTGGWSQPAIAGIDGNSFEAPVSDGAGVVLSTITGRSAPLFVSDDSMASCWGVNRQTVGTGVAVPVGDATKVVSVKNTASSDVCYIFKRHGVNFRTKAVATGISQVSSQLAAAWNGSVYVATLGSTTSAGKSSPDGVTWTARTFSVAAPGHAKALAALTTNGRFVLVNGSTTGSTSTDGVNWSNATFPAAFMYVITNGSTMIAATNAVTDTYYTSTDGVNWVSRTFPDGRLVNAGYLVSDKVSTFATDAALQSNGDYAALFSTDGITWTLRYIPENSGLYSSCAAGIWTTRSVTLDAGVTWYTNYTSAGIPGSTAHNCLSMSMGGQQSTTVDAGTLLTGMDVLIVSNKSGSSSQPSIPNYVRVA